MSRLIVFAIALVFALTAVGLGPARASPDTIYQLGAKAEALKDEAIAWRDRLEGADAAQPLPPGYDMELVRFADVAKGIGSELDAHGAPIDLGCIFRGMAEEAELQSNALKTAPNAGHQYIALGRLIAMFDDAAVIAPDAARTLKGKPDTPQATLGGCEANPEATAQYLTLQP
jgi:hypothetical protein